MMMVHHGGWETQGLSGMRCVTRLAVAKDFVGLKEGGQVAADGDEKRCRFIGFHLPFLVLDL